MKKAGFLAMLLAGALVLGLGVGCGEKENQGGTEQGGSQQGGTQQGGTQQGGTQQSGTEQGGTEQGGTEQGGTEHTHAFAEGWTSDGEYHWHDATCGHADAVTKEAHTFQNGECTTCHYYKIDKDTDLTALVSDKLTEEEWEAAFSKELFENFKVEFEGDPTTHTYSEYYAFMGKKVLVEMSDPSEVESGKGYMIAEYKDGKYELYQTLDEQGTQWGHATCSEEMYDAMLWGGPSAVSEEIRSLKDKYAQVTYDDTLHAYLYTDTDETHGTYADMTFALKFKNGRLCAFGLKYDNGKPVQFGLVYGYGEVELIPLPTDYVEVDLF